MSLYEIGPHHAISINLLVELGRIWNSADQMQNTDCGMPENPPFGPETPTLPRHHEVEAQSNEPRVTAGGSRFGPDAPFRSDDQGRQPPDGGTTRNDPRQSSRTAVRRTQPRRFATTAL